MKEINAGQHTIKTEMYELWNPHGKPALASKEATIEYVPQTKEARLTKIPIVKHFEGKDLAVVSFSDKNLYHELEDSTKKE